MIQVELKNSGLTFDKLNRGEYFVLQSAYTTKKKQATVYQKVATEDGRAKALSVIVFTMPQYCLYSFSDTVVVKRVAVQRAPGGEDTWSVDEPAPLKIDAILPGDFFLDNGKLYYTLAAYDPNKRYLRAHLMENYPKEIHFQDRNMEVYPVDVTIRED